MSANKINEVPKLITGRAFVVSNTLGSGFPEKIYETALARELCDTRLLVEQQHEIAVHHRGAVIGAYTADLLVDDCVLVELKAVKALDTIHEAQCMNYLKATGLPLCLLLNFGRPRMEIKRLVNGLQPNAVCLRFQIAVRTTTRRRRTFPPQFNMDFKISSCARTPLATRPSGTSVRKRW
jgi:GxxExxY protein